MEDDFKRMLLGLGVLSAGALPAFAEQVDKKTYDNLLAFLTNDFKFNFFLAHGYNMWIAWTVLGSTMIASTRYLKGSKPGINMWIHRIAGTLMLLIT